MSTAIQGDGMVSQDGGTGTDLLSGLAKAWGNLNGTGTAALQDSFNLSSITDNAVGDYTNTITNDFASADYAIGASNIGSVTNWNSTIVSHSTGTKVAGSYRYANYRLDNTGPFDTEDLDTICFGDLA